MGKKNGFTEACAAAGRRAKQWVGSAPHSAAEAVKSVARYHRDAAQGYRRGPLLETGGDGIFGGPNSLGIGNVNKLHASSAFGEKTDERKSLNAEGLVVLFSCPRCGQARRLDADWLELAAIAVNAPPQLLPARLLAAWKLETPTMWRRHPNDGDWTPEGFPCPRCNSSAGVDVYECPGYVSEVFEGGLPFIHPAEVRALLFAALNEGYLPPWFFPAMVVYLGVKRPYAARERLRKVVERVRDSCGPIPQSLDEMRQWLGLKQR